MHPGECSNAQLVERVIGGDLEAFGEIVRRYQNVVFATALHCTRNFTDAEDVAQEAFLAAYQNLTKLRNPDRLPGWLRTITLYTYNHWLRKHPKFETADAYDDAETVELREFEQPDQIVEQQELRQHVLKAITALPGHIGEVVTLYYMDGLSYQDIAGYLSVSSATVKGRLQAGRKRLRGELEPMFRETLKQHRPDERFSEAVLEEIVQRAMQADQDSAYDELLEACNEALEVMDHLEDTENIKNTRMDILKRRASGLANWFGKPEDAAANWEEAARLAGELGKQEEQAQWLLIAGATHWKNGQYAALKPLAQQAKVLYEALDDLSSQAICEALMDLQELIPDGWQRVEGPSFEINTGYAAYVFPLVRSEEALVWDWEESPKPYPTHTIISARLRRGYLFASKTTFGHAALPQRMLELLPRLGQTWEDMIETHRDKESLPVRTTVANLTDTVVTPAGTFENCLRLERCVLEPEGLDIGDRMRVYRRRCITGLHLFWFAPGVGLVKTHYEDENGGYTLHMLTEYAIAEETSDYFPLHPGNTWNYQWYQDWNLLLTERCRVVACRGDRFYLTSALYSEVADAEAQQAHFEPLLEYERASRSMRGEAQVLNCLHNIHARLGDQERATELWQEQESLCTRLDDARLHYHLLQRIDDGYHPRERVRTCRERAAAIAHTLGDRRNESFPWFNLADAALRWKDYQLAADAIQHGLAVLDEIDAKDELTVGHAVLDVSHTLQQAPDAEESIGTTQASFYRQEGEEALILHGGGGWSPLNGRVRPAPPSLGFLEGVPLLRPPYEVGASWTHHGNRLIKLEIADRNATIEVPAGVFEYCLLVEAQIRQPVEWKGSLQADAMSEARRGFREGSLCLWFVRGHGIMQWDYRHCNGQRTLIQLTRAEIQESDDSYFSFKPGNCWYYDWRNERGELLAHEMVHVLPRRGERTYLAVSAYAVHPDYADSHG